MRSVNQTIRVKTLPNNSFPPTISSNRAVYSIRSFNLRLEIKRNILEIKHNIERITELQ